MPEPLDAALAALRPMLLDVDHLVRAVAAGRRRGVEPPSAQRAELRPVDLKSGAHLQVVLTGRGAPVTRNHSRDDAQVAVDALLAEPFGNWHVQTTDRTVQLRVTKRGAAQVHTTRVLEPSRDAAARGHDRVKEHLLDPGDELFTALGAGADKRRQVDAFLRQVRAVLPPTGEAGRDRPLRMVDLGCGNAYLTFAAHRYLSRQAGVPAGGVHTLGIDVREDVVERNRRLAGELGMTGLEFVTGEIGTADVADPPDVVLALHACDTATDDALARAARWGAPAVLAAPCCHHDLHRQLTARRRAGVDPPAAYRTVAGEAILRQRFTDVLTDALRADLMRLIGYHVEVVEFVDSRHTPRNAMLRLRRGRLDGPAGDPGESLIALCADWQVRPYLLDALGDLVEPAVRERIGPRP